MAKRLYLFLALVVVLALMPLSVLGADNLLRIAVLPFDDSSIHHRWWGNGTHVGRGVADEFVTSLLATNKFHLIERERIDRVLEEQQMNSEGLVDPQSAADVGKLLGVQYLVIGRVTEFSNDTEGAALGGYGHNPFGFAIKVTTSRVALDVRLVDTSTAEIITSVTGTGEKQNTSLGLATNRGMIAFGSDEFRKTDLGIALKAACDSAANQLTAKAYDGVTIKSPVLTALVAYVGPGQIIIDAGANDGVEEGMAFRVDRVGNKITDPKTGEVIGELTETVGEIKVVQVQDKMAICKILSLKDNQTIAIGDKVVLEP